MTCPQQRETGGKRHRSLTDLMCFPILIVNKKFSTRYYLNLVLVDEEHRRYFKQQEITIFRRRGRFSEEDLNACL
jgi:hypothetical protein